MANAPLTCHVEVHADAVHVIAVGDLDGSTRDAFDTAVQAVLTGEPGRVVLDLTGTQFISSEGMAALVKATARAHDTGTSLLLRPSVLVYRRLEVIGLASVLVLADPPVGPADTAPGSARTT
jgi:anti-anti-sigma factor